MLVAAVVVAVVCARLAMWQLDRLEGRRQFNAAVAAGLARPVISLDVALEGVGGDVAGLSYRRVRTTGRYDVANEVILYGRTLDGLPGNHVLTPLVIDGANAVLVDRGWVPFEEDAPPVGGELAAPSGEVTVEGVLRPPDVATEAAEPPPSRVSTVKEIDLAELDEQIPSELLPAYLQLSGQDPAQPGGLPAPAPLPELSEGPHLGYAVQWFSFATIALIGYGLLLRRERRDTSTHHPATRDVDAPTETGM
jgi:surfeit locus 1 family protein